MRKDNKFLSLLIDFLIGLAVAGAVFGLCVVINDVQLKSFGRVAELVSNSCFITGMIFAAVWFIGFAAGQGTFDSLGFAVESIFVVRNWSRKRKFEERETFYDYRERKQEERKDKKRSYNTLIVGGIFILIAAVFLIVYNGL